VLARARHVPRQLFAPDEPRGACHQAGEGLGREDARKGKVRTAAQMWRCGAGWICQVGKLLTSCATRKWAHKRMTFE
jgi:hypothetical protein